jgi:hypothetical protein
VNFKITEWNVHHDRAFTDWNKVGRRPEAPPLPSPPPPQTSSPPVANEQIENTKTNDGGRRKP